jgi:hypothetical protein
VPATPPATPWRKVRRWKERTPLITGSPSFVTDSVALIPWRDITVSARCSLVLVAVPGFLLTGTEVHSCRLTTSAARGAIVEQHKRTAV